VIVYAKDTLEDPANGAHETFLDEVLPVADLVEDIDADEDGDRLVNVLEDVTAPG
jgi:hypothetical protein